jgi:hypothetical protein
MFDAFLYVDPSVNDKEGLRRGILEELCVYRLLGANQS